MEMSEEAQIAIIAAALIGTLWAVIASIPYFATMARTGQTLGKKWLGIKVVTPSGSRLPLARRLTCYYRLWLSDLVFGLGFLWMLWDDYQQCWHDKLFSTYVIEA